MHQNFINKNVKKIIKKSTVKKQYYKNKKILNQNIQW